MTEQLKTKDLLELEEHYGAHNYHPLPIVIAQAEGIWVQDPEGKKYMDMLSAYSAQNQGHRHPRIIAALKAQADRVTLTSRAFHNDQLGPFLKKVTDLTKMEMALPMNTGAEAVETAIKAARKWGYKHKGVADNMAEIIVCQNNFHGRTTTIVGFSTEDQYRDGFGPFTPGFTIIPYGDIDAFRQAVTKNTVAFMFEPIQGEGGIIVPPAGYLQAVRDICTKEKVLMLADEIQTGLCRTGRIFACDYDNVKPDMYILGKALGGGILPISVVTSNKEVLGVFKPGDHGSTFGGNPLACAVANASIDVLLEEKLAERSFEMGQYFRAQLREMNSRHTKDVRGKGLLIGLEVKKESGRARPFCEALMGEGLLCKETHESVIRFAPPLVITKADIDWAMAKIRKVFLA
jgi:ornithine--oxo-acid transaminase